MAPESRSNPRTDVVDAPVIGVTADLHDGRARVKMAYMEQVVAAGGVPVILPPPAVLIPGVQYRTCVASARPQGRLRTEAYGR